MRRARFIAALVIVLLFALPSAASASPEVSISTEPNQLSTVLGEKFTLTTTLTNTGGSDSGELLAHFNVASLQESVYVDPEDWSPERSQILSLGPGESETLSWEVQAVNFGNFAAYVVVLPYAGPAGDTAQIAVSPLIRLEVAPRSTLSPGGALPVVVLVPLLLGSLAAAARLRLFRRRD